MMIHKRTSFFLVVLLFVSVTQCVNFYEYDNLSAYMGTGFGPGGVSGLMDSNKWIIGYCIFLFFDF